MPDRDVADESQLAELGLQQVFKRELNAVTNFCVSGQLASKDSLRRSTCMRKDDTGSCARPYTKFPERDVANLVGQVVRGHLMYVP